ncbi:phosphoribosylanthranilate isomerase [Hydrogenovibrio sp. SC-1]|uniref:phosphoribosylanthranilate isomerase n=1 Tax=Hydrogenovibrio sp. SC-1 TaxID=2065820 RepID=UPI000C79D123|nr:phosphoribosylanthranilate isomerase [Hydrogenovibrio sp. SC-1]PLA74198.1 phosphoribosylanthranilate isomerase [Hydrogenovibrio sp. SC-1]
MHRTRVKICGITSTEDGLSAARLGADALGFVFYEKSPRAVKVDQAWDIFRVLPPFITRTGLFVNPSSDAVQQAIETLGIDLLQFHGQESAAFCEQFDRPYIKAVAMQAETDLSHLAHQFSDSQGLLLDTYKKGVAGGTGEVFNWDWVTPEKRTEISLPIILAGGLTADNVAQAIDRVQPWAVDVSGGVEQHPGKKSAVKIAAFINQTFK